MSKLTKAMIDIQKNCIMRIEQLVIAKNYLEQSESVITDACSRVASAWSDWSDVMLKTQGLEALRYFNRTEQNKINEQLFNLTTQAAYLIAHNVIAPIATDSEQPVAWLTTNNYMPPIRDIPEAESIWQTNDPAVWEHFIETLEFKLDELQIYMACPEYDNMLYVVDLSRWEYDEVPREGMEDDINGNWYPKEG